MTIVRSILSLFFVAVLWLRMALWLDALTHDIGFALLGGGAIALAIFQAVCVLIERRSRSYQR